MQLFGQVVAPAIPSAILSGLSSGLQSGFARRHKLVLTTDGTACNDLVLGAESQHFFRFGHQLLVGDGQQASRGGEFRRQFAQHAVAGDLVELGQDGRHQAWLGRGRACRPALIVPHGKNAAEGLFQRRAIDIARHREVDDVGCAGGQVVRPPSFAATFSTAAQAAAK